MIELPIRHIVREMRGIPFFLLYEYLVKLDGTAVSKDCVKGSGWSVRLTRLEPFRIGSLSVGQTCLEIEIEEDQADEFMKRFSMKTMRAGA